MKIAGGQRELAEEVESWSGRVTLIAFIRTHLPAFVTQMDWNIPYSSSYRASRVIFLFRKRGLKERGKESKVFRPKLCAGQETLSG